MVLADEPSGNLDHANGERLHDLLAEMVRDLLVGMVVVTHNRALAARANLVYKLEEGTSHCRGRVRIEDTRRVFIGS